MPQAEFTLSELCRRADITPPIMKKYQMVFRLGEGTKVGGRTYYTAEQVEMCRRIRQLRLAEIPYDQIKALKEIEENIVQVAYSKSTMAAELAAESRDKTQSIDIPTVEIPSVFVIFIYIPEDAVDDPEVKRLRTEHAVLRKMIARRSREIGASLKALCQTVEGDE